MERQVRKFGEAFVLEVGSFSGGSAIRFAEASTQLQLPPEKFCLMCVDTWLGDVNMIANRFADGGVNDFRAWLHWDAYHQAHIMQAFCGNLNGARASSVVVPFRAPSIVGMKVLQRFVQIAGLKRPSMLYLDSAHEALETLIELGIAWDLLPDDGILFGDDYGWPAVGSDVRSFAYLRGLTVHLYQGQWVLHKPPAGSAELPPNERMLGFARDFALAMINSSSASVSIQEHVTMDSLKAILG